MRGGIPAPLTEMSPGEIGHAWPSVLAGGHALMFSVATSPLEGGAGPIAVVPYEAGNSTARRPDPRPDRCRGDRAMPPGSEYIAYSRGGDLHVMPFDAVRLAGAGAEQVPVTGMAPAQFAVADSGTLAYGAAAPRDPSWFDLRARLGRDQRRIAVTGAAALSPDGRRVAVIREDDAASDVWVTDPDRGATTRLTYGGTTSCPYGATTDRRFLCVAPTTAASKSGDATARRLRRLRLACCPHGASHVLPTSVAAGTLAFTAVGRGISIGSCPARGGPPVNLVDTAFDDAAGALSPDGRLLAYQSDESGRWEVYTAADRGQAPPAGIGGRRHRTVLVARRASTVYTSGGNVMRAAIRVAGDVATATPAWRSARQAHTHRGRRPRPPRVC